MAQVRTNRAVEVVVVETRGNGERLRTPFPDGSLQERFTAACEYAERCNERVQVRACGLPSLFEARVEYRVDPPSWKVDAATAAASRAPQATPNGTCHECGATLTRNQRTALYCSMACKWRAQDGYA